MRNAALTDLLPDTAHATGKRVRDLPITVEKLL